MLSAGRHGFRQGLPAALLLGWATLGTVAAAAPADMPAPLDPAKALRALWVDGDLTIDLVASEPLIRDPVAIDFGADGRLYVAEMHDYPSGLDGQGKPGGRLNVLSDTDGDGLPDHSQIWADDLAFPTGLMAWEGGVIVCAAPEILWLRDLDGDGRAESRETLFAGFATHNFQARINSPRWGLDGWVYGAAGLFGGSIESLRTGITHALSGRDFRFHPRTGAFEPVSGLTQQGRVRDEFGNWFGCDNGSWMWHFPFPETALTRNPALRVTETRVYVPKGPDPNAVFPRSITLERFNDPHQANRATSACGLEVYRDAVLGTDFRHNAFVAEPVHNLVRRFQVRSTGTSFVGTRAPSEVPSEFLASTDSWFRPVELRTGPDGALWVVDMYRFVIEHPRWITPERLATLDVRAGSDRGRIYRVRPRGNPPRPAPGDLTRLAPREWVRVLASPNGVLRDLAHRLILKADDPTLAREIRALARNASEPEVRVQALAVLVGRNELTPDDLRMALEEPDAWVRRAAVAACATLADSDPSLVAALVARVDDPAAEVRFQLALSLGELSSPAAGEALALLAVRDGRDARFRTAVISSAARFVPGIVAAVLQAPQGPVRELVEPLVATAGASGDKTVRDETLRAVLPEKVPAIDPGQLRLLAALSAGAASDEDPDLRRIWERAWTAARDVLDRSEFDLAQGPDALTLLSRAPWSDADARRWARCLEPGLPPAVSEAAISHLRLVKDARAAELLLANWTNRPPALRSRILDELPGRSEWAQCLLKSLESREVGIREVSIANRQRLLRHPDPAIARRAQSLFEPVVPSDRAALFERYSRVSTLAGDSARGRPLFEANCASCHAIRGLGHAVGPDLGTFRDKPISEFVAAILDPNSVIEPRYANHEAETRDGRWISGVVENETAGSVTLVGGGGVRETLLRTDLVNLAPTGISMMPEGFEAALDPQAIADLFTWIQNPPPVP